MTIKKDSFSFSAFLLLALHPDLCHIAEHHIKEIIETK